MTFLRRYLLLVGMTICSGCAAARNAKCERSRDVITRLGASLQGVGAHIEGHIRRTVSEHYDGLVLSYDMLCDLESHMSGEEFACYIKHHAQLAILMGDYQARLEACGYRCFAQVDADYVTATRRLKLSQCADPALGRQRSFAKETPLGVSFPTDGSPHGAAFILFSGGFLTPLGHAFDIGLAYGWDSLNEIGLSLLIGENDLNERGTGPITDFQAVRVRYTRYLSAVQDLKPFLRGGLFAYSTISRDFGQASPVTYSGLLVEGGLLYDFTRWFGLYGEAILGVGDGSGTAVFAGAGIGFQLRLTD